jgi:methyl-accepting chemotaxis protein
MAKRDVEVDILGRDKTSAATRSAARNFDRLDRKLKDTRREASNFDKAMDKVRDSTKLVARTVGRVTSALAALGSLAGPTTLLLLKAGKAMAAFGKAVIGALPALATLPGLIAGLGLVAGTLKLLTREGSAFNKAFEPISRHFVDAEGNASKFTKKIQDLAAKGVRPLTKEFARVNLPIIDKGMERIAGSVNKVTTGVLKWINTTEGQKLIRTIVSGTAGAMEKLAPKVTDAAVALGRLALKAGDKAITGLGDLIGRILDKFTAWANSKSTADINKALSDLSGYLQLVKDKFNAVRDFGKWLAENEGKVRAFSTALGLLAIALGALSGNPMAIAIGGFSVLTSNMEETKRAAEEVNAAIEQNKETFTSMGKVSGSLGLTIGTAFRVISFTLAGTVTAVALLYNSFRLGATIILAAVAAVLGAIGHLASIAARIPGPHQKAMRDIGKAVEGAQAKVKDLGRTLNSMPTSKTVTINVKVAGLGGAIDAARRAAGGINAALSRVGASALSGWQPASTAMAFAGGAGFAAGGGSGRTGGAVRVDSNVTVDVSLDGKPFRKLVKTTVRDENKRQDWRNRVGKR